MKAITMKTWTLLSAFAISLTGCATNANIPRHASSYETLTPVALTTAITAENESLAPSAPKFTTVYFFVPKLLYDNSSDRLEIIQNNQTIARIPPLGFVKLELLPNQHYQLDIAESENPWYVKQIDFKTTAASSVNAYDASTTLFSVSNYPILAPLDLHTTQERLKTYTPVETILPRKQIAAAATGLESYFKSCLDPNQQTTCQQLIGQFPPGFMPATITAGMAKIKAAEQQKLAEERQKQALIDMEASLPASVRRDKYMVQLSSYLKQQKYKDALKVFPKLEALPIATDPSLKYFYGEALLKTKQPAKAMQKLYQYINEQGTGAAHYAQALEMINQAESQL